MSQAELEQKKNDYVAAKETYLKELNANPQSPQLESLKHAYEDSKLQYWKVYDVLYKSNESGLFPQNTGGGGGGTMDTVVHDMSRLSIGMYTGLVLLCGLHYVTVTLNKFSDSEELYLAAQTGDTGEAKRLVKMGMLGLSNQ